MARLSDEIRQLLLANRYVIGEHAAERLAERGIMEWQIVAGMEEAASMTERRTSRPHPVAEFRIALPDGTSCKAVWSLLRTSGVTKLVTVYLVQHDSQSMDTEP